jgi:hypothetical protein
LQRRFQFVADYILGVVDKKCAIKTKPSTVYRYKILSNTI